MYHKLALCLLAALCFAISPAHAQTADSLTGKRYNLLSKWLTNVGSQFAKLKNQIKRQTGKYPARIARREQQLPQKLQSKLQSASGEFQLLEAKVQDADAINAHVWSCGTASLCVAASDPHGQKLSVVENSDLTR